MRRTRVKICGLTRARDAALAAELGADALGLVFVPRSPRLVGACQAASICREAGGMLQWVGLFLDPSAAEVQAVIDSVALDMLQFHGRESEDFCRQFQMPYLKALSAGKEGVPADAGYQSALALVLDSHRSGELGGTGKTFDWKKFPTDSKRRWILAGGLTPDNVAAAVAATRPYAVDVSSGVESASGVKDRQRLRRFFEEVRRADFG